MKQLLNISLIILLLSSCDTRRNKGESHFLIKGKFSNAKGEKVLLSELTVHGFEPVDSVKISPAGEFYFRHIPGEKSIYTLQMNNDAIQLVLDKGDTVCVEGDILNISKTFKTRGSSDTKLLEKLRHYTDGNFDKANTILDYNAKIQDLPGYPQIKDSIDNELHKIFLDQQQFVKIQINSHAASFGALFAYYIYQKFGRLELFTEDEKMTYSQMLDSLLLPKYPENSHIRDHHARVSEMKRKILGKKLIEENLQTGKMIPDIEMNDTTGNPVKLSSLRGNIVFLNFWSAGCGKCRLGNLKLVKIYNKYRDKGFEIYSVFIGPSRQLWTAAIQLDKISWIQVSDLSPQSSVKELFNLPDDIYRAFLIDQQGMIIEQNPEIELLEVKLKQLLHKP